MFRIQKSLFSAFGALFTLLLAGHAPVKAQHLTCLRTSTSTGSVPLKLTNFNTTVAVPRFDPSRGTLVSVQLNFTSTVQAQVKVESTDLNPTTIYVTSSGRISLRRPSPTSTELTGGIPPLFLSFDAAPYDGAVDFAGTSGKNFGTITSSLTTSTNALTSAADLTLFTGTTPVSLTVSAVVSYLVTSNGNRMASISSLAGADVQVVYTYLACQKISGNVVNESIQVNGVQQVGEAGISGVTVTATGDTDGDGDTETISTTTDASGVYVFEHLYPGNYTVTEQVPSGYSISPGTTTQYVVGATTPNQTYGPYNFFLYTPVGSIGDIVWYDVNNNSILDAGEPGIEGVTVTLLDSLGSAVATATTDPTGHYLFDHLAPDNYTVRVETSTLPAGFALSTDSFTGSQTTVPLGINQTVTNIDFGYTGTGSIGDHVGSESIGNTIGTGFNGVTVHLLGAGPDGQFETGDDVFFAPQVTSGNGDYLFSYLPAGLYRAQVEAGSLPPGYTQSYDADGIGTPDTSVINLNTGENNLDQDFRYKPLVGSISGSVYSDDDRDGVHDGDEPGLPNITLTLKTADGNAVATTTTDSSGAYTFGQLTPGEYVVWASASVDGRNISTSASVAISLAPGEDETAVDFGYLPIAGNGATRPTGFWQTRLQGMQTTLDRHGIDLGALQAGPSPNGGQNLTSPAIGDVMAIFWGNGSHQGRDRRTDLGSARLKLASQLIAAMANLRLLGTTTEQHGLSPTLIADARAALDGVNVGHIAAFTQQLEGFNNSGAQITFTAEQEQVASSPAPQAAKAAANKNAAGDIHPGPAFR